MKERKQHHKINQKTAQQIVDTVKDVCGQDINYIDLSGTVFASTDASRVGTFHEIGRQVAMTCETVEVEDDNTFYGTHAGVNIPIIHNGEFIAVIGISGKPDSVRKYAYLAQKITVLLLREHELDYENNTKKNQMNYMIRALIDEEQAHTKRITELLQEYEVEAGDCYQLIMIRLNSRYNPNNLAMIENTIYHAFQALFSKLYTFNYPNEYLAIVKSKIVQQHKDILEKLAKNFENILKIAISAPHKIDEQFLAYSEVNLAVKGKNTNTIRWYEKLGLEILCANVPLDIAQLYKRKYLLQLKEEEIELLRVYYEENMSLAKTSERLFLHKNTIQYQLDRIHKITGYNPRKFQDAVAIYAALLCE